MKQKFFKTSVGLFLLGAVLANFLPSIIDPIHFWFVNYFFPTLSGATLVFWQIFDWYLLDSSFYLVLLLLALVLHIKKVKNIKIIITVGGIIGLSIVIGILSRIILKF